MNPQDFSDSGDESNDSDYKPPGEEENLSEIDSDDPIEDDADSVNSSAKISKKSTKKRTKGKRGPQKKIKNREIEDETNEKTKEEVDDLLNSSVEDKKRLDALWEEFQRPITKKSSITLNTDGNKMKTKELGKVSDKPESSKKRDFEDLFESSDSFTKVANNDDVTNAESPEHKSVTAPVVKKSGGLASILSQIGKKDKLTVLEKSKQDWDGYKKKEGIAEELVTHNKGKDGFLEKRDFLERTDLRQFELEKAMRAANRLRRN